MQGSAFYGEFIAILTTLSWTICIFPFTEAARRLGPNAVNHFRLVVAVFILSILAFIPWPGNTMEIASIFSSDSLEIWLWLGLSGIIGLSFGDYFGFTMYAILGTRLGSLFTTFAPAAALLLGFFMLSESVNFFGLIGMIITTGGVAWVALSRKERNKIEDLGHGSIRRGIIYGILAALCQGAGLVLAKKGMMLAENSGGINPLHATWLRMIVATIGIYAVTIAAGRFRKVTEPIINNQNNGLKFLVGGVLFGPVMGVTLSLYTITLLKVSIAQTIFALVPVFVLPLGYLFYKEKITLKALSGALVAIAGVLILIWRNDLAILFNL